MSLYSTRVLVKIKDKTRGLYLVGHMDPDPDGDPFPTMHQFTMHLFNQRGRREEAFT